MNFKGGPQFEDLAASHLNRMTPSLATGQLRADSQGLASQGASLGGGPTSSAQREWQREQRIKRGQYTREDLEFIVEQNSDQLSHSSYKPRNQSQSSLGCSADSAREAKL